SVDVLSLDKTWLPTDVTLQVPRTQILQSTEFRRAVQERLIALIDEETAQKLLRSEGAEEEQLRIQSQRAYIRAATGVQPLAEDTQVGGVEEEDVDDRHAHFEDWLRVIVDRS